MHNHVDVTKTHLNGAQMQADRSADASASDLGRVKVSGINMHFADADANTKDFGRVRVGFSSIRF